MHLNQTKTFTKEEFLTLAKRGLQLELGTNIFLYDPTYNEPAHTELEAIQGYIVKDRYGNTEHIHGFWSHFNIGTRFTVIQLPNIKLLKSRALN